MGSCADRLHQIQRDVGLTGKELKAAVKEMCTPRKMELPVFHEKKTAEEKLREKVERKAKKKRKVQMVYWFLEEYLKPEYAQKYYYQKYLEYDELIEKAYEGALDVIQLCTYVVEKDIDPARAFPDKTPDDFDIPDDQWGEFEKYCDKHPLKSVRDIVKRRNKFKKHLRNKRYKKYSPKRLRMYDPYYAASAMDAKEMIKAIKDIGKQNETRIAKFRKLLDDLTKDQSIGALAMQRFNQHTEEMLKQHRRRLNELIKKTGQGKPQPVIFDFDGVVTKFDDWDDPESIDSVFRVPIKDL